MEERKASSTAKATATARATAKATATARATATAKATAEANAGILHCVQNDDLEVGSVGAAPAG
jgi:hypothetical protein